MPFKKIVGNANSDPELNEAEKQNKEENLSFVSSSTGFSPRLLTALFETTEEALAGVISKYHLATKNQLRQDDLERYALAIITVFKFELKESYYIPRSGDRRNYGGKLKK
ncbi:uncharacterized protein LOC131431106 isoform X2 [Malaya genurostris]|uniref:uncharacterized protein LOC131431106 isoform X1 n=1 Tax=Malaya genurostris TaxID=325434 RepID=UPI0026F40095|nr:uncharacterized protein LOC131431106 isoform X1 [Malaya genurostris]XP_058452590.1 uncharacterized protein LOC131431106 isoform X2 [Malaya genurostris]XP_058452593.1 uncharacterized protein LOC131431106 isoform X2 [Malaya genurostris]